MITYQNIEIEHPIDSENYGNIGTV